MPVRTLPATEALHRLGEFDTVIDARSEDEHALDHLPDAINWPTLDNAERIQIGTIPLKASTNAASFRSGATPG